TSKKCKNYGIHTAIETALNVPWENALKVIPYTDLVFADFKIADSDKHKQYTGSSNSLIIQNLQKLSREHTNVILRIPVIPKVNDSEKDMNEFASIINTFKSGIKEIELLKYNNLAESKYAFSGREYTRFADSGQTNEEMNALCAILGDKTKLKCYCI
ncbi:MAG: radical SAM protein, partial [Clostridia bacterium]|nr:radical SAM protein [Clostridia bacterium]